MLKQTLNEEKIELLANHFEQIMEILGLDIADPSLEKTPERIAKMYVEELFSGLNPENFPTLSYTDFRIPESAEHLITITGIRVQSICMHHFVPFTGTCSVSYIPNGKILGLSKINRVVEYFCRRPQLQEKLTGELLNCFCQILDTEDVAIRIEATHQCVTMRGIRDANSKTITEARKGNFLKELL